MNTESRCGTGGAIQITGGLLATVAFLSVLYSLNPELTRQAQNLLMLLGGIGIPLGALTSYTGSVIRDRADEVLEQTEHDLTSDNRGRRVDDKQIESNQVPKQR